MAISIVSQDEMIAALIASQKIPMAVLAVRTATASTHWSVHGLAGQPGAGTLAGTSTAAGVVPTDATAGFPTIDPPAGSGKLFLAGVQYANNASCRIRLYDCLFKAGAYAFNANTTLASQPSYSSRIPDADYKGTEIWIEAVTAFTGNPTITIGYQGDDATTGRSTGAVAFGLAPTVGRLTKMPFQSGDEGVMKIESVLGAVASVGTFNVLVLRPLWAGRVQLGNGGDSHGPKLTFVPEIFGDTALMMTVQPDSTSTGLPELTAIIGESVA